MDGVKLAPLLHAGNVLELRVLHVEHLVDPARLELIALQVDDVDVALRILDALLGALGGTQRGV